MTESTSSVEGPSAPAAAGGTPAPAERGAPAPLVWSKWLLRITAVSGALAAFFGNIVAPGMRGNASETMVVNSERISNSLAYFFCGTLLVLLCGGAYELSRAKGLPIVSRVVAVACAGLVIALSAPALIHRLHPPLALALALSASAIALASGVTGLRAPHTRAPGAVLAVLAFAALVRLLSWEVATAAGERASVQLYNASRALSTAGFVLEGLAQIIGAAWLGARGRWAGRILSNLAVAGAFVLTWGAARGMYPGAALWQSVLHSALADAPGVPAPYAISAVATFLVCSAILLALVAAVQPGQVVAVVAALSFALVSRGAFDAPLRALAISVAGHWLLLARADPRAMWQSLQRDRDQRIAEERSS